MSIRMFGIVMGFVLAGGLPAWAGPRVFETAEAASTALIEACRAADLETLRALVEEKDADEVFGLRDPGREQRFELFAQGADNRLVLREVGEDEVWMIVGYQAFHFPVPIVKGEAGWSFAGDRGMDELLTRTIGWNEIVSMSVLERFVDAQVEYASVPRDGTVVRQYARRFLSTPGERDGLYWESDIDPSPFGPLSLETGAAPERGSPYFGYHYRVLTGQGAAAPGGAYSYEINGNLVVGFAAIAWPAEYGRTGVQSFIVNHYGVVHEADLGEETAEQVEAIQGYDPDDRWRAVE